MDRTEPESSDIWSTKTFYERVFGWTFTDFGPAYMGMCDNRRTGVFRSVDSVPEGGPLVVIYTRDLEALKSRLVASGGKVVKEIFSFPGGRRFHFIDPRGSVLAVWSDR